MQAPTDQASHTEEWKGYSIELRDQEIGGNEKHCGHDRKDQLGVVVRIAQWQCRNLL